MSTPASFAAETELTRVALGMLDIPFEPAAASSGELFDTVIDELSAQIIEAAGLVATPVQDQRPSALCEPSLTERRRSKRQIRKGVLARNLAGQREVLAQTPVLLRATAQEVDAVCQRFDVGHCGTLLAVIERIGCLANICQAYATRHARIAKLLRAAQPDLEHLAESAARNERTLVRELMGVTTPKQALA